MGPGGILLPSDSANPQLIDDSSYSDLLGFAADVEIDLRDLEQLQHAQPVADVLEHEHEVVVVLEGLQFHMGIGSSWSNSSSTAVSRATSSSVNPARPTSWPAA